MSTPAWSSADYGQLIDRLLHDLALARGLTPAQLRLHYALPDRPPMHRPQEVQT